MSEQTWPAFVPCHDRERDEVDDRHPFIVAEDEKGCTTGLCVRCGLTMSLDEHVRKQEPA